MSKLASNIFAAFAPVLAPASNAPPRDERKTEVADMSLGEHLLFPVAMFVITFLTIEFSRYSNLISTIWPTDAIMLAALLRYARSRVNYASVFGGGFAATVLAGLMVGNSLALNATLTIANLAEVIIALVLLTAFKINSSTLTSFKGILSFMLIVGGE